MKKVITLAALVFASVAGFAQMKPQAGDSSIGIDATPFLTYAGGLLSNAGATAPSFVGTADNPIAITMKQMRTDDMAIVTRVGFGITSERKEDLVGDETLTNKFSFDLFGGLEKRRGEGRIVGLARAGVAISQTANADGNIDVSGVNATETKGGNTFAAGAGLGLGLEYFIAPMVSLEGRYDATIGFSSTSERETDGNVIEAKSSSFGLATNPTGSLILHFWFR
jgi:hypothetical protein